MPRVSDAHSLRSKLDAARARRAVLLRDESLEAVRIFHGRADGIEGLVIEKWGPALIIQIHEGHHVPPMEALRHAMIEWRTDLGARAVYLKQFVRDRSGADARLKTAHHDATPWIGEPIDEEYAVRERGLKYLIRPFDGFSVGLFLEHRENRRRIAELSNGRRVLNAFAYACGFSVAAAGGGAASVASVDLSKRYLEWGKRNFELNQLPLAPHRFYASDVFDFFKRAKRQKLRFDVIVLDPPTFSRSRRPPAVFELRHRLDDLVSESVRLLDAGGDLLLATNDRQLRVESLESAIHRVADLRVCRKIHRLALPPDFAGDAGYSKSILASF